MAYRKRLVGTLCHSRAVSRCIAVLLSAADWRLKVRGLRVYFTTLSLPCLPHATLSGLTLATYVYNTPCLSRYVSSFCLKAE